MREANGLERATTWGDGVRRQRPPLRKRDHAAPVSDPPQRREVVHAHTVVGDENLDDGSGVGAGPDSPALAVVCKPWVWNCRPSGAASEEAVQRTTGAIKSSTNTTDVLAILIWSSLL